MSAAADRELDPHGVVLAGVQLIEASAGTGKTWNIAALYARAILELGLPVRQLLVVTFTRAAVAELRDRIRRRLSGLLQACEQPSTADAQATRLLGDALARTGLDAADLTARLRLALGEFDQSAIHTIHGFCQRALADAPLVAGAPLEGELTPDDSELACAVMRDCWRRRMAARPLPPALAAALLAAGEGPDQFARMLQLHQGKPLAAVLWPPALESAEAAVQAAEPAVLAAWSALVPVWQSEATAIGQQLRACLPGLDRRSYAPAAVERALEQWQALVALGNPRLPLARHDKLRLLRASLAVPGKAAARSGAKAPDHPFFQLAEDFLLARQALDRAVDRARAALMHGLLEEALPALAARKREARVQAYDDLLTGLHRALAGPRGAELADSLRVRYPLALVDEFQDTDPVQLAILRRIYQADGVGLLMVGDPKQAIYAFRNADLHSYLDARAGAAQVWTLAHNQRASEPLIAAHNALFGRNPRAFLIEGLESRPVAPGLRERTVLAGDPEPRAALQVWLLPRTVDGMPCGQAQGRALALACCADEIVRLLQEGDARLRLGARALGAGDIAVLVRSHADGRAMRIELARRGVGSVELSQNSVFASQEAADLACVLAAVLAPRDTGQVLAALATTLLGGSAASIEEVRGDESLLAGWTAELSAAQERWHGNGFAAMFWPLAERHGVLARLLAGADGARRLTNLRQLSELLQAAATLHPAPQALLAWFLAQTAAPAGDEERQLRLDSDAALVQIVTVHRSKGLEYPVVFCPALWAPPRADGRGALGQREYHRDGQACIDYRDGQDLADGEDQSIEQARAIDRFAEDLRLLYVALTRAANRCYLVGGAWQTGRGSATGSCTSAARTALSWLVEPAPPDFAAWQRRELPAGQLEQAWHDLAAGLGRPEALAIAMLPSDRRRRWRGQDAGGPLPQALPPPRLPERRRIGSYTGLVGNRTAGAATALAEALRPDPGARDHDVLAAAPAAQDGESMVPALDILNFPRGADAGTCLHAVFEHTDFSAPAGWPAAIARSLADHAGWLQTQGARTGSAALARMLQGCLGDLAAAPLPGGLRLSALDPRRCLHELEFHLPAAALEAAALRALLARHGLAAPALRFETLRGYLKGFIDLVVEHQGRWYVIDWKSNHLGWRRQDYAQERVRAVVEAHDYGLQALIYLLALDRLLRCRLAGYRPERDLGGALYLFVRGVRPGWTDPAGHAAGCWYLPAPLAALRELGAALDGGVQAQPA